MNDDQLKVIEERAAKASPGPWDVESLDLLPEDGGGPGDYNTGEWTIRTPSEKFSLPLIGLDGYLTKEDANFIAAARFDVPALVAEVRRLRDALEIAHDDMGAIIRDGVDERIERALFAGRERIDRALR